MSTGLLVGSSVLKILFVIVIAVGVFAPVLIWAERRQSAMIQDRLGPSRAAIVLPPSALAFVDKARLPLWRLAALTGDSSPTRSVYSGFEYGTHAELARLRAICEDESVQAEGLSLVSS